MESADEETVTALHNLPSQTTSFIGREAEKTKVARLLETARVVTLTGAGGSGKTRLAGEVARETADRWEGAVWWVDLAGISEPELVAVQVASVLGLAPGPDEPALESIVQHVRDRKALLVLDNCEHLIDASAGLVAAVVHAAAEVAVVATSREGLHVDGETIFAVPPLSLPDDASGPEHSDAFRLFVERARQVRPNFRVDAATAPAVTDICRRLDGIPLAIELAAARVRMLAPSQIAEALADRFRLLTGGPRTAMPRQRTLDASVEWSYRLLSAEQQLVFCRLSVFAGTFSLDAAEHVCADEALPPMEVLDLLAALVDRSLVQVEEGKAEARYRLLESIRVYARDRLPDFDDAVRVRNRHLEFFTGLAGEARVGLLADFDTTFARLRDEVDNLRAAMDWAMASGRPELVIHIVEPVAEFWLVRGLYREIHERLAGAVNADGVSAAERARGLAIASNFAYMGADFRAGYDLADGAIALEEHLESAVLPLALVHRAWCGWHSGKATGAQVWDDIDRACTAAETQADPRIRGRIAFFAGTLHMFGRSVDEGKKALIASLRATRGAPLHPTVNVPLHLFIGNAWNWDGDSGAARPHYEQVLRAGGAIGYQYFVSLALVWLGGIELSAGNRSAARARIAEARKAAPRAAMGHVLATEGFLAYDEGRFDEARRKLEESIELERGSLEMFVALVEVVAGELARETAKTVEARRLFESARSRSLDPRYTSALGRASVALARLDLAEGDIEQAALLAYDGIELLADYGDRVAMPPALTVVAAVAARTGAVERAARLLGASDRADAELGLVDRLHRAHCDLRDETAASLRAGLGGEEFDRLFSEGASLSLEDAVGYARRGRGERGRPPSGWQSLTPTEVEVVRHVAEGRSNAEIADRLFVSPNTVKTHLAHVYAKLDLSSRAELAAAAARRDVRARGADLD